MYLELPSVFLALERVVWRGGLSPPWLRQQHAHIWALSFILKTHFCWRKVFGCCFLPRTWLIGQRRDDSRGSQIPPNNFSDISTFAVHDCWIIETHQSTYRIECNIPSPQLLLLIISEISLPSWVLTVFFASVLTVFFTSVRTFFFASVRTFGFAFVQTFFLACVLTIFFASVLTFVFCFHNNGRHRGTKRRNGRQFRSSFLFFPLLDSRGFLLLFFHLARPSDERLCYCWTLYCEATTNDYPKFCK